MGNRETSRGFSATQVASTSLNNSTTETTIFTQSIPAGKMGTSKELSGRLFCSLTTPAISLPSLTLRLKLGSSVLTVANSLTLALSQTNTPFFLDFFISNKDSANSQLAYAMIVQNGSSLPIIMANANAAYANWTEDTTVNSICSVTAQFGLLSVGTTLNILRSNFDLS